MKRYTILLAFSLLTTHTTHSKPHPIITWDLHDVLLKKSGTLSSISVSQINNALWHLNWPLVRSLWRLMWCCFSREISSEEVIMLARKYNNPELARIVINVANAQMVAPGMLDIVRKLHELGYTQHVVSNIGKSSFQELYQSDNPSIKELFSYLITDLSQSHVVVVDHDTVIKKPNKLFFKQYLDKNHLTPSNVIFIDDKKENIDAAKEIGLNTIQFINPADLIEKLHTHGINLSTTSSLFEPTTMISTTTAAANVISNCIWSQKYPILSPSLCLNNIFPGGWYEYITYRYRCDSRIADTITNE